MPLSLNVGGSDDEDGGPPALGVPPPLAGFDESSDNPLAGLKLPEGLDGSSLNPFGGMSLAHDITDNQPAADPMSQTGFMLSQSGAFKVADFQIRKEGGLLPTLGEDAPSPSDDHARPGELGTSHQTIPELHVQSINDLEMLGELGSGASGTVYKARHAGTDTMVAVKAVTILEKAKRDQVVKELRIMRKHTLGARWLVGMHNAFYEDAKVFTVLEFMNGGSIEDMVMAHAKAGGLRDERELARIGRGLLEGLNYLHRQLHQVHRDLKPANVMLSTSGDVKISDFGISSQLDNTSAFCETFVGTTCYMSPERLSGEAYSFPADVWAFGIIMIELATGKYPYKMPNSYFELLGSIMDNPAPALPSDQGFSAPICEFVAMCVDKSPNLRVNAKDLLKHPWLRSQPAPSVKRGTSSSLSENGLSEDSRHDREESPRGNLERSRSNLSSSINSVDLSGTLAGLKLEG